MRSHRLCSAPLTAFVMVVAMWAGVSLRRLKTSPTPPQKQKARRAPTMTPGSNYLPVFARPYSPMASAMPATLSWRRTEWFTPTPGLASTTTIRRCMLADFSWRCRTSPATGKADVIERFGETVQTGGAGGSGIGIYKGSIYAEINDRIVRYSLPAGGIVPTSAPETIVSKLPLGGDHPMHPFIIDAKGSMFVDVATATNSCQPKNRQPKVPGADPCTELETRGGVWRYDANKTNQTFSPAERFATGIRNAEGFAIDSAGRLFVSQHGRDQLHTNWPDFYKADQEATLPAEEVMLLRSGGDYGWPECYYDPFQQKLVLAPEYGGDGGKTVGVCANKLAPAAVFPAHWAPNAMVHYDKKQFPSRYRDGIFIAFHGSWNRAPYPQGGYNVVFQQFAGDHASGNCEIFADGFAGAVMTPEGASHRPSGLAVGPDGALYVADDVGGRIYRIVYKGGAAGGAGAGHAMPKLDGPGRRCCRSLRQAAGGHSSRCRCCSSRRCNARDGCAG